MARSSSDRNTGNRVRASCKEKVFIPPFSWLNCTPRETPESHAARPSKYDEKTDTRDEPA
jgi:hypothetical protein